MPELALFDKMLAAQTEKSERPLLPRPASVAIPSGQAKSLPHIVTDSTKSMISSVSPPSSGSNNNQLTLGLPLAFRGHHRRSSSNSFSVASSPSNRTKGPPLPLNLTHSNTSAFNTPKEPTEDPPPIPSPAKPSPRRTTATPTQFSPFPRLRDVSREREKALESIASVRLMSGLDPVSGKPTRPRNRTRSATAPSRPVNFRHISSNLTIAIVKTPTLAIQEASPIDSEESGVPVVSLKLNDDGMNDVNGISVARRTSPRGRSSSAGSSRMSSSFPIQKVKEQRCENKIDMDVAANGTPTKGKSSVPKNPAVVLMVDGEFSKTSSPLLPSPIIRKAVHRSRSTIAFSSTNSNTTSSFSSSLSTSLPHAPPAFPSSPSANAINTTATSAASTRNPQPTSAQHTTLSSSTSRPMTTERSSLSPCIPPSTRLHTTNTTTSASAFVLVHNNSVDIPTPLSSESHLLASSLSADQSFASFNKTASVISSSQSSSLTGPAPPSAPSSLVLSSAATLVPYPASEKLLPSTTAAIRRQYGASRVHSTSDATIRHSATSALLDLPKFNLDHPLSAKTSVEFARLQTSANPPKPLSSYSESPMSWAHHSIKVTNAAVPNDIKTTEMVVANFSKELDVHFGISDAPHSAPLNRPVIPPPASAPTGVTSQVPPASTKINLPKIAQPSPKPAPRPKTKKSRWADDVLQRFRRVEPTEILNKNQIQALKEKREAEEREKARKQTESQTRKAAMVEAVLAERERVNVSSTPEKSAVTEPKVEEKSQSMLTLTPVLAAMASAPAKQPLTSVVSFSTVGMTSSIRKDFSAPLKPVRPSDLRDFPSPSMVSPHTILASTPNVPSTSLRRSSSPIRNKSLPTIPEVTLSTPSITTLPPNTVTTSSNHPGHSPSSSLSSIGSDTSTASAFFSPKHAANGRSNSISSVASSVCEEDEDFIYFHAAPTSKTNPRISHGRIRISKADSGIRMSGENSLNWTAFQMAILGTDDFYMPNGKPGSHGTMSSPISEAGDIDELDNWLCELNLADYTSLVKSRPETGIFRGPSFCANSRLSVRCAESISDMSSGGDSVNSTPRTSEDIPRPSACIFPEPKRHSQQSQRSRQSSVESLSRWKTRETFAVAPVKWEIETPKFHVPKEAQAPKKPIVNGDRPEEYAPMGCNLHDLGDFLQFEAQHLYAIEPQE